MNSLRAIPEEIQQNQMKLALVSRMEFEGLFWLAPGTWL